MELRGSTHVRLPPEATWDAWTDAARFPAWQGGVLAVRDVVGAPRDVGAVYTLDHGPKLARRVKVTASDRPSRYVIEEQGLGVHDVVTATFEPEDGGTRLTVTYFAHLNRVMRVLARFDRSTRMQRDVDAELARFVAVATRTPRVAEIGHRYIVRAGPFRRQVVVAVDTRIHVRLLPGWARWDDAPAAPLKAPPSFPSDFRLWPITPPLRSPLDSMHAGLPFLTRDGGHGVAHLALAPTAWADAEPVDAGLDPVTEDDRAAVDAWLGTEGATVGMDPTLDLAPLVTLRLSATGSGVDSWAVAKILKAEMMRVHLAIYGRRWSDRPEVIDPADLRLGRMSDEAIERGEPPDPSLGVGHVPVDRGAFGGASPRFAGITTLEQQELDGLAIWREHRGGTFSTLEPLLGGSAPRDVP